VRYEALTVIGGKIRLFENLTVHNSPAICYKVFWPNFASIYRTGSSVLRTAVARCYRTGYVFCLENSSSKILQNISSCLPRYTALRLSRL